MRTVLICFCGIFSISANWPGKTQRLHRAEVAQQYAQKPQVKKPSPILDGSASALTLPHREPPQLAPISNCLTQQYSCQKSKKNFIKPETFSWTTKRKYSPTSKQIPVKKL